MSKELPYIAQQVYEEQIKDLQYKLEIEKNKNYIFKDFIINNLPFSEEIIKALEEEALG